MRDLTSVHQPLELPIGIIPVAFFAEMFLVVEIEVEDDRRRIGEAEEQAIAPQSLLVAPVFPEGSLQTILPPVGVLRNDDLVCLPNTGRKLDDWMSGVVRLRQAVFEVLDLFFERQNSLVVDRMVFQ